MQFNLIDLKELLSCLKDNSIQCLNIKQNSFELTINKETVEKYRSTILSPSQRVSKLGIAPTKNDNNIHKIIPDSKNKLLNNDQKDSEVFFTIVSPMVGTFYRSPAPSDPFFIELNDEVKTNQTVCIVEAMKLMNEIEAEIDGKIIEILVDDGDIVDCGQPLMKIKPN
uniref:Biotin carboxyl carrier protein of acetyl-CoA carboxylase n=1 Tax=Helminthora furcellata TaxID=1884666 RepID=A0A1G4NZH0_9FLOR|nr:Acetyl-CoA carboxylase, biotin carboxyl carrier protein [Helminthora furcellata]SCW21172.1 Acetyl-CoA carboxylase, biotin carboxyl carrier protein [Helminthora furcellata]SCW24032.1 Acetyl-CoA carboxylase, biotin carboxyl carrier protein [Helminthora furcellata]